MKKSSLWMLAAAMAATAFAGNGAHALDKIEMVVFGPPSLGAFLPPIIKAQKFDAKHGLDIAFTQRPPGAYNTEYNTGKFKVGGSAAVLQIALSDTRGVPSTYLFNIFDFWGTIVTSDPAVKTLKDLEGKTIAASKATTNWKIFEWLAARQGVDVSKFQVVNSDPAGLMGYAMANRASAIQMWEPAVTTIKARKPSVRTIDIGIAAEWKKYAGSSNLPYLGVSAHRDWIAQNKKLIPHLFMAYKDAGEWAQKNPAAAAKLILPTGKPESQKAIADLLSDNSSLAMNLKMAADIEKEMKQVYKSGVDMKFLSKLPSDETIYTGK